MTEIVELTPGQGKVLATKELVVRVKVRGYGRGQLTVEASATGGLFASASKSGPDACDWTAGRRAVGWRVVIEPQWWVHASDFFFVRFGSGAAPEVRGPDYLGVEFEPLTSPGDFSVAVAYESDVRGAAARGERVIPASPATPSSRRRPGGNVASMALRFKYIFVVLGLPRSSA